jgi:ferredoxin
VYFGFWRKGCVCPVGSVQNVVLALADPGYLIPAGVLLFFLIPLLFTLFFGRTFCAAVCPLGAIQDVVAVRPVRVPAWISGVLGLVPYIYLGLAVLFAAAGGSFLICLYDPFVGFFRLGASFPMLLAGGVLLLTGIFVARPYCRFLCPYSVLLGWCSRLARRHVTITPDDCINCRLCDEACPFDAILKPTPEKAPESRKQGIKRLGLLLAALPSVMLLCGWAGHMLHVPFARSVLSVEIAEQVVVENRLGQEPQTLDSESFRVTGKPLEQLIEESRVIQERFRRGGLLFGLFVGLVIDLKLIGLAVRRRRTEYTIDRQTCVSCARCFMDCPKERERLKRLEQES